MNTTTTSPWRTRSAAACAALFALYVLAMAAAFTLGNSPAGWGAWTLAAIALAGAVQFAHRSTDLA